MTIKTTYQGAPIVIEGPAEDIAKAYAEAITTNEEAYQMAVSITGTILNHRTAAMAAEMAAKAKTDKSPTPKGKGRRTAGKRAKN